MVLIVLTAAVSLVTLEEFRTNENSSISIDDFSSQTKTVKIKISDGVGSKLSGFG